MLRSLLLSIGSALAFGITGAQAQNSVDIGLVPGQNNNIEVRLRFESDFDGYFAASVFTIRWSEASGASLGTLQQVQQVEDYQNVNPSGPVHSSNGYRYQVYAGFGTMVLSDIPLTLIGGEWFTLCTIPVNGSDVFTIVNDDFTTTVNGDYYISLGGQESQGDIISSSTAIAGLTTGAPYFSVHPSVTAGSVTVEADLRGAELVGLSVLNEAGQLVWADPSSGAHGALIRVIDLAKLPVGTYVVRLRLSVGDHLARVVKL